VPYTDLPRRWRCPGSDLSQLPDNPNTSVTNMAEYLPAEVIWENSLPTPLTWIEHYPEHEGEIGEYSLVRFSDWEREEVCLGGIRRLRIGAPSWSHLRPEEVEFLVRGGTGEQSPPPTVGAARAMSTTRADALRPFQVERGRMGPTPTASR
jgi:hypothetical protein